MKITLLQKTEPNINGDPDGGMATIERKRAEAIQVKGDPEGRGGKYGEHLAGCKTSILFWVPKPKIRTLGIWTDPFSKSVSTRKYYGFIYI